MIKTQSQNQKIRQIKYKVGSEVNVICNWVVVNENIKVREKVWWKVWSEVMHEGRIKKVREKFD